MRNFIEESINKHQQMIETLELIKQGKELGLSKDRLGVLHHVYYEQMVRFLLPIIKNIDHE